MATTYYFNNPTPYNIIVYDPSAFTNPQGGLICGQYNCYVEGNSITAQGVIGDIAGKTNVPFVVGGTNIYPFTIFTVDFSKQTPVVTNIPNSGFIVSFRAGTFTIELDSCINQKRFLLQSTNTFLNQMTQSHNSYFSNNLQGQYENFPSDLAKSIDQALGPIYNGLSYLNSACTGDDKTNASTYLGRLSTINDGIDRNGTFLNDNISQGYIQNNPTCVALGVGYKASCNLSIPWNVTGWLDVTSGLIGEILSLCTPPPCIFNNQTNQEIVITDGNAFTNPTGGMSCTSGGCAINPNSQASAGIGDIAGKSGTFSVNGATIFTLDFSTGTPQATNTLNSGFNVTVSGMTITIKPQPTISFVNNTSSIVDIVGVDSNGFINYGGGLSYNGKVWIIQTGDSGIATISDIGQMSSVSFQLNDNEIFKIDFTQTPVKVLPGSNLNSGYAASSSLSVYESKVEIDFASIITFENNTQTSFSLPNVDKNGFITPTDGLVPSPTNSWTIAGGMSPVATIGDVKNSHAVDMQSNETLVATIDFTTDPVSVFNIDYSGFNLTSSIETNGSCVSIDYLPVITFKNNTSTSIVISGSDSNGFSLSKGGLSYTNSGWQITGGQTGVGVVGDLSTNKNASFQANGESIFTLDFTALPSGISNVKNSGYSAAISGSKNNVIIEINLASTVSFSNTSIFPIQILSSDSGAFITPTSGLSLYEKVWILDKEASPIATIGSVKTNNSLPFQVNNNTVFSLDFTQNPVVVKPALYSGFLATSVSSGSGSQIKIESTPVIIFTNNTDYTIEIVGSDSNSFSSVTGGLLCGSTGCVIAHNQSGSGVIGDLKTSAPITFQGVNSANKVVFTFSANFNGSSPILINNSTPQDIQVSGMYGFNQSLITINPATIYFVNSTEYEIDMVVDENAFSSFSSTYSGSAYPIQTSCTTGSKCSGVIGDLLNSGANVSFTSEGATLFNVDFTKSPFVISNIAPNYSVTQTVNSDGTIIIGVEHILNLKFTFSGGITQLIEDLGNINNVIYSMPATPLTVILTVSEQILPSQVDELSLLFFYNMGVSFQVTNQQNSVLTINTAFSTKPLSTGGAPYPLSIQKGSTFNNNSINGNVLLGFSAAEVPVVTILDNPIVVGSLTNTSFNVSKEAIGVLTILTDVGKTLEVGNNIKLNIQALYAFSTGSGEPGFGKQTNTLIVASDTYSFTLSLGDQDLSKFSTVNSDSTITINDPTLPVGKNQIVLNILGSFSNLAVTGSFYGQNVITTGQINSGANPTITITGATPSGVDTFNYTNNLTGDVNLNLS